MNRGLDWTRSNGVERDQGESLADCTRVGRAEIALFLQELADERRERRRHVGSDLVDRPRVLEHDLREHGDHALARERRAPREARVEHAPEREEIRAAVDAAIAAHLLGRHVRGRSD